MSIGFSPEDFAKALAEQNIDFRQGQVVKGTVSVVDRDEALVDIGAKATARLPIKEASLKKLTDLRPLLTVGEELDFMIVREQDANGQVTLSLARLAIARVWEELKEAQERGDVVQAKVTRVNRGGVLVNVEGLRGFVPRSHLVQKEAMEALVGQTLTLSYLDVQPDDNKLVLSERLARRAQLTSTVQIGQLVTGTVVALKPYGAFVDFGLATGLLHISAISQERIQKVEDVLTLKQSIQAVVLSIDEAQGRISLSTKVLEKSPGEMLTDLATVMAEAEKRAAFYRSRVGKDDGSEPEDGEVETEQVLEPDQPVAETEVTEETTEA